MSTVGDNIEAMTGGWTFGNGVANTFDEHAIKSIPGYLAGHDIITKLSDYFVGTGSLCFDIGCSTGTLLDKLSQHHRHKSDVNWVGVEIENEMVEVARSRLSNGNVTIINEDSLLTDYDGSDFITAYYTLQFIRPKYRQNLVDKIYESLNWGGALVLFEKVRAPDARFQDITAGMYMDFKLNNGFSEAEIIGKSRSIRYAMEPFSSEANVEILRRAGFKDIMTIYKEICFEGFVAIK